MVLTQNGLEPLKHMTNFYQLLLPFLSLYMYDYVVYEYVYSSVCKYLYPYIWVQSPENKGRVVFSYFASYCLWIIEFGGHHFSAVQTRYHISFRDPLLFAFLSQHWNYRCIRSYTAYHMDTVDLSCRFHAMQQLQFLSESSPSPDISLRQHPLNKWILLIVLAMFIPLVTVVPLFKQNGLMDKICVSMIIRTI